mmetsp:Transcript_3008/g.7603  ORF Transcript_3008/g.7603 Transcript_3008/m.7603 type:complete len:87 (+) Transcript_3008:95-355(+)
MAAAAAAGASSKKRKRGGGASDEPLTSILEGVRTGLASADQHVAMEARDTSSLLGCLQHLQSLKEASSRKVEQLAHHSAEWRQAQR